MGKDSIQFEVAESEDSCEVAGVGVTYRYQRWGGVGVVCGCEWSGEG